MKELSIEEKAKRYDEAIDKIKYVMEHGVSQTLNKEDLQDIFPELKESEDEKVRKKLINLVKKSYEQGGYALHKWEADEMLAWLEKQGELVNSLSKGLDNAHERIDGLIQKNNSLIEQLEKKSAEWSEEDKNGFINFIP